MERVAVIFNPAAGNGKLGELQNEIQETLETTFSTVMIYQTNRPGDGADLVQRVANDVDLIIAAGGDGTVHEVINALAPLTSRPAFAIIPGGTSNDFSREIGMIQDSLKAAEQISCKKTKWIDIGQSDQHYFLNFWGIGLITQVSETVDLESKQNIGRLAYYLKTIQSIGKVNAFHFKIETEKETITDNAVMVIIGNGTYIGGIRAFFPEGDIQDGLFDILIIKEASVQAFFSMFQSKVGIQTQNMEGIIPLQAKNVKIETMPYQKIDCDGERKSETPSTIKVLPKHIEIVIGL
ncbi:diacylglycerol kinase family protein [Paraliobacillus sp. JSM ZJ581]|uniref:diacylglycerol/lipid kinase family protein n=1 Tax=Paraliobacillus sp. JSM ZJ581 TaxID=3342118 RepID=UPI0035A90B9E